MTNRIRELRMEKRITQLQLSIELGVTQETISAYEHGKHLPSLPALMKMSEIFGTSMDYIMGRTMFRYVVPEDDNLTNDKLKEHLLDCYRRLGSRNKARLISYAEGLLDSQRD